MSYQNKPGWVTAVAIIAIILSGFGAIGGLQEAMSPMLFEQQRQQYEEMISEFEDMIKQAAEYDDPANKKFIEYMRIFIDVFEKILNMPEWYKSWMVISGFLQLLVNGFYLFSAIWLLQLKPPAIRMMLIALPASIILGLIRIYIAQSAFGAIGIWVMSGTIVAVAIEVALLLVILKADKGPFRQFEA